jgi:radical SAM superfamily enzyme YgiQ (UPF0313 family)
MFLFVEPISKNTGMYVPAYPLPILEITSFIKINRPDIEIKIISVAMDYGLPLNKDGKKQISREFFNDLAKLRPKGVGISCTAISQAEEVIDICNLIKKVDPDIFIFLGGYFPTIYYEEIFSKTRAVDLIVLGEGEEASLKIVELLHMGKNPITEDIPGIAWKKDGQTYLTRREKRFDLAKKALLNLDLLMQPREYDILPYAFSRGCSYGCNFCMEEFIRPHRRKVPSEIIHNDLKNLTDKINAHTLLVSDALFKSFDLFPLLRSLGMKVNFESRCDVLDPSIISGIADVCGIIALGFESASYSTLRRMNKVKNKSHYEKYIANTIAIFKEAVRNEIPMIIFMISGYPGDTEKDLKESLVFIQNLSKYKGPGGHIFKVGECHVYPKTKIYELAVSLPDVVFDDDGVFGQNIVRQPSKNLDFGTILDYNTKIFKLSNYTQKINSALLNIMPFFRLPARSLRDDAIPDPCFKDNNRSIFNVQGESLSIFRKSVPVLTEKYKKLMSDQRNTRILPL